MPYVKFPAGYRSVFFWDRWVKLGRRAFEPPCLNMAKVGARPVSKRTLQLTKWCSPDAVHLIPITLPQEQLTELRDCQDSCEQCLIHRRSFHYLVVILILLSLNIILQDLQGILGKTTTIGSFLTGPALPCERQGGWILQEVFRGQVLLMYPRNPAPVEMGTKQ